MIDNFFVIFITYYFYLLNEYIIHRISHYKHKYNIVYFYHINHHKKHYTVNKPILPKPYIHDKIYNISIIGLIHSPLPVIYYFLLKTFIKDYYLLIWSELFFLMLLSDYIHTNIHIKNIWLEKYTFFIRCRENHILHHKYLNKNYALSGFDNTFDILFKTKI